jgi:hypothetical protein
MTTTHPYIAFTLAMTCIIGSTCFLLSQIEATYRHEIRKIDAATTAVDPGQTYAFTATRESDQGVSLQRSRRNP